MSDPAPALAPWTRWRGTVRIVGLFALAYALAFVAARANVYAQSWIWDEYHGQRWMLRSMETLYRAVTGPLRASYAVTLTLASVLAPIGALVRLLARGRARAGLADPLEHLRALLAGRPRAARVLSAVPAAAWTALLTLWFAGSFFREASLSGTVWLAIVGFVLPTALAFFAQVALVRRGLRALAAPTAGTNDLTTVEANADGFTFQAVAVTTETRAAVAGMALLPLAFFGLLSSTSHHGFSTAPVRELLMVTAYVAATAALTVLFCRASRIAVGVDGVRVQGTSRLRFFPYREVDGARVHGSNLELYRGTRTVLRLQLHGDDAPRREALLARLEGAIARAHADRGDPVAGFLSSASRAELARAAGGASDYRSAAVSRDQLWALLEGPAIDAASRRAAAEALGGSRDRAERERLRVIGEQCAEPAMRVRIAELLAEGPTAHDDAREAPRVREARRAPDDLHEEPRDDELPVVPRRARALP
jgi:hypothetical protein